MINLLFDYDGTLHDCSRIYCPAFRKAYSYLVETGYAENRSWTDAEISQWLGYGAKEMWNRFAPDLPQEQKDFCSSMIGEEMLQRISRGEARLYADVPSILKELKSGGYRLIFLSNCKLAYMELHRTTFSLDQYFSGFYCTEMFHWKPKTEIFSEIHESFPGSWIIIGDRFHDLEVARQYSLPSIACTYGYGMPEELQDADAFAASPSQLPSLIAQLAKQK